jgi:hypothetical protein
MNMQMKTSMTNPSAAELRKIASEANVEINYEFDAPFCAISQEDVLALADEIETLRAALKVAQQSLLEFSHAQESGPSWYTRGENGMYSQVSLWLRRGLEAVQGALGPYDDNGQYLKERAADERPQWLPPEELLAVSNRLNQTLRTRLDRLADKSATESGVAQAFIRPEGEPVRDYRGMGENPPVKLWRDTSWNSTDGFLANAFMCSVCGRSQTPCAHWPVEKSEESNHE